MSPLMCNATWSLATPSGISRQGSHSKPPWSALVTHSLRATRAQHPTLPSSPSFVGSPCPPSTLVPALPPMDPQTAWSPLPPTVGLGLQGFSTS